MANEEKTMRISIEIQGITPLICNRFHDSAQQAASDGTSSSAVAGDKGTPLEIAEKKLYYDFDDKTLGIPQPNLLRSIVDGGIFHKAGRSKITTQKSSLLYACLDIEGAFVPLHFKERWRVDSRPVRNPVTGGRIICHRPMFDDWVLRFVAMLDTELIGVNLLRQIVDDAGKRIGLGDYRPSCKGPFGKYVVTKWVVEVEKPLKVKVAA